MIFLNIKKIEKQIVEDQLTEKDGLFYLLSWIILFSFTFYLSDSSPYTNDWFEFADFFSGLLFTILGIQYIFKIHKQIDNNNFLKSFISLSFVHFLRLVIGIMVITLLGKIILYVIPLDYFLLIDELLKENFVELLISITFSLIFYFLLINSFKKINNLILFKDLIKN